MDKKYRIEYLPVAQEDLMGIVEYIQFDSNAAQTFLDEVDETISKLPFHNSIIIIFSSFVL